MLYFQDIDQKLTALNTTGKCPSSSGTTGSSGNKTVSPVAGFPGWGIAVIVVGIVILAAGVVGVLFVFRNRRERDSQQAEKKQPFYVYK